MSRSVLKALEHAASGLCEAVFARPEKPRKHGYATRAAAQVNHDHHEYEPVDLPHRWPSREKSFSPQGTQWNAEENVGRPSRPPFDSAFPVRYNSWENSILRPRYGRDK